MNPPGNSLYVKTQKRERVGIALSSKPSLGFDLIAFCDKATPLGKNKLEHPGGIRVRCDRQTHR